jgi:hypothetical protein
MCTVNNVALLNVTDFPERIASSVMAGHVSTKSVIFHFPPNYFFNRYLFPPNYILTNTYFHQNDFYYKTHQLNVFSKIQFDLF